MQTNNLHADSHELQKIFLNENRAFLDAIRKKMPIEEILNQYEKVRSLFETIKERHEHMHLEGKHHFN